MRRLILLAATVGMVLLVASPTFGQAAPPGPLDGVCEGSGEGDPDCARGLLEGLEAEAPGDQYADEIAALSIPQAPAAVEAPVAAPTENPAASTMATELPDTGGAALIPLAAGAFLATALCVAGGLLMRRR